MTISAIAAMSKNRVIGKDNQIPWYLPNDLKYFKKKTTGHHLLMGRKSFRSIGKPLPNRVNIVLTRDPFFMASGIIVAHSVEEALNIAKNAEEDEFFIAGGGEIYRQCLPITDRIYLTEIDLVVEGDTFFPELPEGQWKLIAEDPHPADEKNKYAYNFKVYQKR
nr:dihydrofolate reductase [Saprospiraceae bacterium]